ncbi:DUF2235 domain-containing protein [Ralstonia sp. 1138]|uniref:T6SS phospholipase effector Tle1-like catalytic domain-containing protein n=1 Tax=Ralstonia sp. 1138 TaxID=3156423 RepID=UPI003393C96F
MLDDTQMPSPAGQRPLTSLERQQRADAMACFDPTKRPGMSDCSQSLWISLFFDGTKNNMYVHTPKSKHSNVARLFLAHELEDESKGMYPIYVNGLGSPFPEIGETTFSTAGLAFAAGGEKRLQWAMGKFEDRIKKAKARATNPQHPIRMINVALFGFSRGAALARAFAVRLAKECRKEGEGWRYQGYPIRLYFMGLFDTVASVGVPAGAKALDRSPMLQMATTALLGPILEEGLKAAPKDGHYDWAKNLKIPAMAEQCIHYVAAHEVRDSFPLDSVRDGKSYPSNTVEVVYPGVHTDVGGAYAPGEQTRSLRDDEKLSQVPLLHMHRAARVAGVPIQSLETMGSKVQASFALSAETAARFDHYRQTVRASGSLEMAVAAHLYWLYGARSHLSVQTKSAAALSRMPEAKAMLAKTGNNDLVETQDEELRKITNGGRNVRTAMDEALVKQRNHKRLSLREATLASAQASAAYFIEPRGLPADSVDFLTHGAGSLGHHAPSLGGLMPGASEQSAPKGSADTFEADVARRKASASHAQENNNRRLLLDVFDYLVHDSVAGFGSDLSKLQNWRMMYFGDLAYEPENDWTTHLAEEEKHGEPGNGDLATA